MAWQTVRMDMMKSGVLMIRYPVPQSYIQCVNISKETQPDVRPPASTVTDERHVAMGWYTYIYSHTFLYDMVRKLPISSPSDAILDVDMVGTD